MFPFPQHVAPTQRPWKCPSSPSPCLFPIFGPPSKHRLPVYKIPAQTLCLNHAPLLGFLARNLAQTAAIYSPRNGNTTGPSGLGVAPKSKWMAKWKPKEILKNSARVVPACLYPGSPLRRFHRLVSLLATRLDCGRESVFFSPKHPPMKIHTACCGSSRAKWPLVCVDEVRRRFVRGDAASRGEDFHVHGPSDRLRVRCDRVRRLACRLPVWDLIRVSSVKWLAYHNGMKSTCRHTPVTPKHLAVVGLTVLSETPPYRDVVLYLGHSWK